MVTKRNLVIGLVICAAFFIIIQFYLLYRAPSLNSPDDVNRHSHSYNIIKDFVNHCKGANVACILVDQQVLKALATEKPSDTCTFFCWSHIYTFAIRDLDFQSFNLTMLPKLKASGYDVLMSISERFEKDQPTHVHLRYRNKQAIHLVVLHDQGKWWWYGSDLGMESGIDFTKHDGAMDKFDFEPEINIDGLQVFVPNHMAKFMAMYADSLFIPCNKARAEMFHKNFSRDTSNEANEFREAAANALKLIKSRLDAYGIPFWLSSGTLLGWFRQCDFIPYSIDVDVGVFIKDHTSDLLKELQASALRLDHKFGKVSDSLQYTFDIGKVKLDIFFFYEDKVIKKYWNGGTDYSTGEKFKYWFDKFTLCWTEFYDMKVRVPCDTELYIKANYGPDWFKPVKHWEWNKSPPNVVPNGEWEDDELDEVIQLWDKKGERIELEWVREEL